MTAAAISKLLRSEVERGRVTGAVAAVAVGDRIVHFDAYGYRDPVTREPMPSDAIFRMASSTKPVVGVGAMILMERGVLHPTDPVSTFLSEFRDMQVVVPEGRATSRAGLRFEAARRDVLVRDLLTHTSGLHVTGRANASRALRRRPGDTLATFVPRLGKVVLAFQPGTRWRYGNEGIDVLARVLELASGQPIDAFLRDNIFEPLGMRDTFFVLPADRVDRLVPLYWKTRKGLKRFDDAQILQSQTYLSGAGGLLSTASDVLRFETMLTNGGTRVLRQESVRLMSTDRLADVGISLGGGVGFGYTVQVMLDPTAARSARSPGAFGWMGYFGTVSWSDPSRGLCAVLLVQQGGDGLRRRFERAVYTAVS